MTINDLRTDRLAMLPGLSAIPMVGSATFSVFCASGETQHGESVALYATSAFRLTANLDCIGEALEHMIRMTDTVYHGKRSATAVVLDQRRRL